MGGRAVGLVWGVVLTIAGSFMAYGAHGGWKVTGVILLCGAFVAAAEFVTAAFAGRREERVYRTYDGP
ncbi:MAG: hypothetical protein JWM85_163 [Acidimicrobiaceae bacterium]|nr:hypothetical protein [Acidimicrobiaceae bacterium]